MAYDYYPGRAPNPVTNFYGGTSNQTQPIETTGYKPLSYLNLYGTPTTTTSLGVQTAPSTVMLGGNTTAEPVQSTEPATTTAADKPHSNDPVALTPTTPVNTATVSARPQLTPNVQVNNSFDYNRATPCEIMPNGQCRENTNPNDVFTQGYMANMRKNGGESLGDVMLRGLYYGRTAEQQLGAEQGDNDKLAYANALNSPEAMAEVTRLMKGGMSLDTAKSVVSDNVLQQLGSHRARALYALPKAEQALKAQTDTALGASFTTVTPWAQNQDYLGLSNSGITAIDPTKGTATLGGSTFTGVTPGGLSNIYGLGSQTAAGFGAQVTAAQSAVAKQQGELQSKQMDYANSLDKIKLTKALDYQIAALEARSRALQKTGGAGNPEKDQIDLQLKRTQLEKANLELDGMRDTVDSTGGK